MSTTQLLIASISLLSMMTLAAAFLYGWQGWLELKNRELDNAQKSSELEGEPSKNLHIGATRIELSDLKERIRKLEAIANGVDL